MKSREMRNEVRTQRSSPKNLGREKGSGDLSLWTKPLWPSSFQGC